MDFKSDNITKIHPQILESIISANTGVEPSYGNDSYTHKLKIKLSEVFEKEISLYLTSTGTAANSLALSALTPGHGLIYSHTNAHVNQDECGAPNLFSYGAKIEPISGDNGKIHSTLLEERIKSAISMRPHASKPSCITVSQATESGTIYKLDELSELKERLAENPKLIEYYIKYEGWTGDSDSIDYLDEMVKDYIKNKIK